MKTLNVALLIVVTNAALHASAIVGVNEYQVDSGNSESGVPNGPAYVNTTGYTSQTTPLNLSLASSDGYSSGYLNATGQFGLLQISTVADAVSQDNPIVENYANAAAGVYFEDVLTLSDPGAPADTQISLLVTAHLDDSISDVGDPYATSCPSEQSVTVDLDAVIGTISDSSCGYQAARTLSQVVDVATNAKGIATYDADLTLYVGDSAETGGDTAYGAASDSDTTSVTASGYLTVQVETPNVTVTSASGTNYSIVQTADAPEPSTYVLLGAGFVGLGLIRRRR
jgi:PEP-CTERM motif